MKVALAMTAIVACVVFPTRAEAVGARGKLQASVISSRLNISGNAPTWGAQIPKIVYDGRWFYVMILDRVSGADRGFGARIFQSRDGKRWREALTLKDRATGRGFVYQPLGLLIDGRRRLHVIGGCYTGGECYPGVRPADPAWGSVYSLHLVIRERRRDGSFNFRRVTDRSLRTTPADGSPLETSYQGLSIDPPGRFVYQATNDLSLKQLWLRVYDTRRDAVVLTRYLGEAPGPVAGAPCGRAWLYPRIRPGARRTISLSFHQHQLCRLRYNADAVLSWQSLDGGRSFPSRATVTELPQPDAYRRLLNFSDSTLDARGRLHLVYFVKRDEPLTGFGAAYYQRGSRGRPERIGRMLEHAQIALAADGRPLVFSTQPNNYVTPVRSGGFVVARREPGGRWARSFYAFPTYYFMEAVNLLTSYSGSRPMRTRNGRRPFAMIVPGALRRDGPFSTLLFVRYYPSK